MKVLITGSSGFVGRYFAKRLCYEGHEVTGVDIAAMNDTVWPVQFDFVLDDVRRYFKIRTASQFDLIIHCAAVVGGRMKIDYDPLAVATNLSIDSEFFHWIVRDKKRKPQRVIYFSSSAIYPPELQTEKTHVDLAEALVSPTMSRVSMPDQTYGFSKLAGELLAHHAVHGYGAEVVIYRPFGGYGTDQDLSYPFPAIIQRVFRREDPIHVWGSGDQVRDFIHIDDVVEGVLSTYSVLPPGRAMNLGTGIGTSFRELAQMVCNAAGHHVPIVNDEAKPQGVFRRVADTVVMEGYFKPKIGLGEGIKRALQKVLTTA